MAYSPYLLLKARLIQLSLIADLYLFDQQWLNYTTYKNLIEIRSLIGKKIALTMLITTTNQ
jgi:hypothetical protein